MRDILRRTEAAHRGFLSKDGEIVRCLDEGIVPGTSGGYSADCDAVTIEVSNSKLGEPWAVSDKALNSLILLCADIAKRNGLGRLEKGKNLCWHQMYAATACPGRFLLSKMDYIAEEANKINYPPKKKTASIELHGINVQRKTDFLVLYKDKPSSGTNKWGTEVPFNSKGIATSAPVSRKGNMNIPKGGYVLSGHGKSERWIKDNVKAGARLSLNVNISL